MFKATFISNIKRWWWIPALNAALMLLIYISLVSASSGLGYKYYQVVFNSFMAALCALMLFSFLHTEKSVGLYFSLPSKRGSVFLANLLFGFLSILFCSLLFTAAYIMFDGSYYDLIFDFFCTFTYAMSIFALVTFVSMFTGRLLAAGIFSLVMYVLPIYISGVIDELADEIYGFAGYSAFKVYELYKLEHPLRSLGFTAVLLLLAYIAYRLRPAEAAGELVTFRWAKTLFIQGVALCVGLLISGTFMYSGTNYIMLTITGLIIAAAAMMLMQRSFRIKGYPLQAGIFIVIVALLYALIALDITGYENRVPAAEDVASVTVDDGIHYRQIAEPRPTATLETTEDIEAAVKAHSRIASEKPQGDYSNNLFLHYELKNGKTLDRYYHAPEEYMTGIANTVPFRRAYFMLDEEWTYVQLSAYKHTTTMATLTAEEAAALRAAVEHDVLSCTPEELYKYYGGSRNIMYIRPGAYKYDNAVIVNESMPTTWPLVKELMQKYELWP
ncbi:MAG: hypothetical protein J1F63_09130 [Oscillospiraceae bacterium]|nr:hypothetical protein [Oscillospiraceae bacterium]